MRALPLALLLASVAACASRTRLPLPLPPSALSATAEDAFAAPPDAMPATGLPEIPEVDTRTLPNGLTVLSVRRADLPLVSVRFVCRASGTQDRDVRPGVDTLLENVLGQIGHLHSPSLRGSSEPTLDVTTTGATLVAAGSSRSLGAMVDTMAFMVRTPGYTLDVLAPQRHVLLETIAGASRGSSWMLGVHERELIFGANDPRAGTWWGTAPDFGRLHPEDLAARHAQLFAPSESALVVVGDATADEVAELARGAFGDWVAPAIVGTPLGPAAFPTPHARLHAIPSGGDESELRLREHAPMREDPDRPAFDVVTALLGGMFSARLNRVLREERGHTYGIHASVSDYRAYATLGIDLAVPAIHMRSALLLLVEELGRVTREGGVDESELAMARTTALASFRNWFFSRDSIADLLASTFRRHATVATLLDNARAINDVDAAAVTRVAQHWIRVETCPILVIGPYSTLAANIQGLPGGNEFVVWRW